ncbi:MAG: MBL fold metallo-hydrolase [Bacteroidetes bacterium]|nr:MBL fold metallo-hydrolase [Bacteroidota bacterium]
MINVASFTFNAFQENSFVLSSDSKHAVIIDPGCYTKEEEFELVSYIEQHALKPIAVLNTHAHIDHILGNQFCISRFKIPLYLHKEDHETLERVESYAHVYGFENYKVSPQPTHELYGGLHLVLEDIELTVYHTPGHSSGHVVFYNRENKFVINGDVLFQGSFGRTDLPGGDLEVLKQSIFGTMFQLPEETIVYCGHGPQTTIGREKRTNYIHQF